MTLASFREGDSELPPEKTKTLIDVYHLVSLFNAINISSKAGGVDLFVFQHAPVWGSQCSGSDASPASPSPSYFVPKVTKISPYP